MAKSKKRSRGWRRVVPSTALALGLSACAEPEEPAVGPGADVPVEVPAPVAEPRPPLPEEILPGPEVAFDTILVEGTAVEIAVQRFTSEAGFPLPFVTRLPEDMVVNPISSGEADAVRFEAEFGGLHNPDAYLALYVPNGDVIESLAEELGATEDDTRRFGWSSREFRLQGERLGFVAEGERDGRTFYLILAYPPEYGDGIGGRIDLILRNWRWADGSPLGG